MKPPPIQPMKQFPANARILAKELEPILLMMEQGRRQSLANMSKGWKKMGLTLLGTAVTCILILLVLSYTDHPAGTEFIILVIAVLAGLTFCFVTFNKYIKGHSTAYRYAYKHQIIGGMSKLLHSSMTYSPRRGISETTFRDAGLYTTGIDRYGSEDLFSGKIGKTEIMFSEIHAEDKKKRTNSAGHTSTHWVTIFKGVFFIADFNKNFRSWLTIRPDFAEKSFGWFGRKIQAFSPNLIRLENPEFEKAFVVHGSDQVEARYILTPDMQERLLTLRNRYGANIRLSLKKSQLYLTIPNVDNWFEPNMKLPANDITQMQTFLNQMSHLFNVVEMLDLNTRIWSKH